MCVCDGYTSRNHRNHAIVLNLTPGGPQQIGVVLMIALPDIGSESEPPRNARAYVSICWPPPPVAGAVTDVVVVGDVLRTIAVPFGKSMSSSAHVERPQKNVIIAFTWQSIATNCQYICRVSLEQTALEIIYCDI